MVLTMIRSDNGATDDNVVVNIPPQMAEQFVNGIAERVIAGLSKKLQALLPAMIAAESDRLCYDLDQLADATTLSRRTLESYVADGTLASTRVGRRLVVFPESARAFLRSFNLNSRGVA